jgi:hypothetical protein
MLPVSIRFNNPGALNTATWIKALPGYIDAAETTPGNHTARFDTPEQGVAAWWELLRRYRMRGSATVGSILTAYGGGQDYSDYLVFVCSHSGLARTEVVDLQDDEQLLRLAQAMFYYEAGCNTPLTDAQIIAGFTLARARVGRENSPGHTNPSPALSFWTQLGLWAYRCIQELMKRQ